MTIAMQQLHKYATVLVLLLGKVCAQQWKYCYKHVRTSHSAKQTTHTV
jgi:L-lysine 2,3-aminomutase